MSPSHSKSLALMERAQTLMPGGVNSPVRAFRAVGGTPIFIAEAKGAYLTDVSQSLALELTKIERSRGVKLSSLTSA